jgi:carbonic anhydrase
MSKSAGLLCAIALSLHVADGAWGYDRASGPATWSTAFPTCGGSFQSPIDIIRAQVYGSEVPQSFLPSSPCQVQHRNPSQA